MTKILGIHLERFGSGRDGGVDLTDNAYKKEIVIQVKHYVKTGVAGLIRSLKNELPKVKEINPKQYYICCSKELSPQKKSEIYSIFSDYMDSPSNIITLIEIDDFLSSPENDEILRKHFKLWIDSTAVLTNVLNNDIFIDCEALLYNIENDQKLFVKTTVFDKAIASLNKNNVLIILGDPGVGKTITSKMLVLHYATQNYKIRYTTDGADLAALKRALSSDRQTKEVILLDDCFGQVYFSMKDSQEDELIALIRHVRMNPNKLLIMNSRVTIYHEATARTPNLITCMHNKEFKVHVLDMTDISSIEKAKIFYNHLYFKGIPEEFFAQIKHNKNYRKIIEHRNYNPRIIEYVCEPNRLSTLIPGQYMDFIMKSLDNPEEAWKNEYERRLKEVDRLLITTIYSLSSKTVSKELVRQCYNHRLSNIATIDLSINHFEQALARLSGAFVKHIDKKGVEMLSIANPSINDFIKSHLEKNEPEKKSLINSCVSVRQLKRLLDEKAFEEKVSELFNQRTIIDFYFESENQKSAYITYYTATNCVLDKEYEPYLDSYLRNVDSVEIYETYTIRPLIIIESIISKDYCEFYNKEDFFRDLTMLEKLVDIFDLSDLVDFIKAADWLFVGDSRKQYIHFMHEAVLNAIETYCYEVPTDEYDFSLSEIIDGRSYEDERGYQIDADGAVEDVEELVRNAVKNQVDDYLYLLPKDISITKEELNNIRISVEGAESLVFNYLNDYDDDDERIERAYSNMEIDNIFNR